MLFAFPNALKPLEKVMNPSIRPPGKREIIRKLWIQFVKLRLKNDLVLHPVRIGGVE